MISAAINKIISVDFEQAMEIGRLKKETERFGLSLGDRACISLGLLMGYPIYTADKAWAKLQLSCDIILVR
ncbi:hypothetical protein H6P87_01133 [Rickettsia tillamookensis]|uniref:PIN domain-containing protein n=1 Tax=Rickettsia tillamookensis TaxID=2761623 RepID=A0A9E6MIK7_9RICK|nr:hypothetical protein H6P87_01133 [Rickettsia tillamookensis]